MKLGIIGPKDSVIKINETFKRVFPEIIVNTYIEEKIIDAPKVLEKCQAENDGIIFTGIGVMNSVLNSDKTIHKPYEHIPRSGPSIFKALWEIQLSNKFPESISTDVTTDFLLKESLEELNLSFNKVYNLPFSSSLSEDEYLKFHEEKYLAGNTDVIITGFGAVYTSLKSKGYPVYRLYPTNIQIREAIEKLLFKINTQIISDSAIAVQVIKLASGETSLCQYELLKKKGYFELKLLEYVQEIQGALFNFGRDEYIIFSTRGAIKGRENMVKFLEIINIEKRYNFSIFSGIGYGSTSYIADVSARKALEHSILSKFSSLFIQDGKTLTGPIGEKTEVYFNTQTSDKKILKISEITGIKTNHIDRLLLLCKKAGKKEFDAQEIADYLSITERSARRIFKKLIDNNFGSFYGKETSKGSGRPKNIIKLKLD